MDVPSRIRFELINGLSESEVKSAEYLIYAHKCSVGTYVGLSKDPVKRWREHVSDASNMYSQNTDDRFREAIRGFRDTFKHYILATATFEKAAKKKEAAAISYYGQNLNVKPGSTIDGDYGFKPIDAQIPLPVVLEQRSSGKASYYRKDSERVSIVAEVFEQLGRKRLRCIENQPFEKDLLVECSREERSKFNIGDKVKVKVQLSEKRGKKYLVAARTAKLVKIKSS